jgi:hypothetical protein
VCEAEADVETEAEAEAVHVAVAVAIVGAARAVGRVPKGEIALTEVAAVTELLEVMALRIAVQCSTTSLLHLAFCTFLRSAPGYCASCCSTSNLSCDITLYSHQPTSCQGSVQYVSEDIVFMK